MAESSLLTGQLMVAMITVLRNSPINPSETFRRGSRLDWV